MSTSHQPPIPSSTEIVVIGGGIIGTLCALELAEQGHRVVCVEKGQVGRAQSGRNLGWIRQQGRDPAELPLMIEACRLWQDMARRCGSAALSYEQTGINYLGRARSDADQYERFAAALSENGVTPERLDSRRIAELYPGSARAWRYGLRTPSDGRIDPVTAVPAIANTVQARGGRIFENCAVHALEPGADGHVRVETERGEIRAERVVIAGGIATAELVAGFTGRLPQLCVESTITEVRDPGAAWQGSGTDGELAFYRNARGDIGLSLCRGFVHRIGRQTFRHLRQYRSALGSCLKMARLALPAAPAALLDPDPSRRAVRRSLEAARRKGLISANARIRRYWAGTIDLMPDFVPVLDTPRPGSPVFVATGFSGHGFGIAPAAARVVGTWAADAAQPHDLSRFRFARFFDRSALAQGPTF